MAKIYKCSSCGATTAKKGHLCAPAAVEKAYVCEYCGEASENPRHVCSPMLADIKFSCENCGRVSTKKSALCQPKPLKGLAKKAAIAKETALKEKGNTGHKKAAAKKKK